MTQQKNIKLNNLNIANDKAFTLIAGPCQMESRDHALMMAESLKEICDELKIGLVYKSSFDKANRTSLNSKRGIGLEKAIPIFAEIKKQFNLPTLTDIHEIEHCKILKNEDALDILQIPAFLCRQTDLLIEAAKTKKIINVKKGQFLAPWDMQNVVKKISDSNNDNIIITERGASFGYNTLVSDMRSLEIMKQQTGYPIIFDATHSVQQPGGQGGSSGGQREFVPVLARSAIAVGIAGLFMEVHQDPNNAPSDGPCMAILSELKNILKTIKQIDQVVKAA